MSEVVIHQPADFDLYIPQILSKAIPLIYLHGHLGAGKTTFVKQLGKYLGITKPIVSPTFTYIREYSMKRGRLYHLDLYRFEGNLDDVLPLSQLEPHDLVCIEWAENIPALAALPHLDLYLSYIDENTRTLIW